MKTRLYARDVLMFAIYALGNRGCRELEADDVAACLPKLDKSNSFSLRQISFRSTGTRHTSYELDAEIEAFRISGLLNGTYITENGLRAAREHMRQVKLKPEARQELQDTLFKGVVLAIP